MHLDHAHDVAAVAVAELGVDLVVDRVELAAELARSARGSGGSSGLSIIVRWPSLSPLVRGSEVDLDRALGRVDAGADHLARRCRAPRRCAGRGPSPEHRRPDAGVADAHPAAEGQRRRRPPRRRRGSACVPSDSASTSLLRKRIVPPSPSPASPPSIGWKRSMWRRSAIALLLPVLGHRVEHRSGPGEEGLALAPVGAELVEVGRASMPSVLSVCSWCRRTRRGGARGPQLARRRSRRPSARE